MEQREHMPLNYPRERLIALMHRACQKPICLVYAEAGYGKTTLVKQYLAQNGGHTLYLALKPLHNLFEAFWHSLVAQLKQLEPDYASRFEKLGVPLDPSQQALFFHLLQRLARKHGTLYLVLDDLHTVLEPQVLDFVFALAQRQAPAIKLILLTRTLPDEGLQQLIQSGHCDTIESAALAFTHEELAAYLAPRIGQESAALLDKIQQQTGGWPLAVRLLFHMLAPEKPLEDSIADIRPVLNDTLDSLFFKNYVPAVQHALVRVSLWETIYPELADTIPGFGQAGLDSIAKTNPFITRQENGVFHIHHLYLDFLRGKSHVLLHHIRQKTYENGAAWLAANGHHYEALACCRASRNYEAAWQLITQNFEYMPSQSYVSLCMQILAETPEAVFQKDCHIQMYAVLLLLCRRHTAHARALLDKIQFSAQKGMASTSDLGEVHLLYGLSQFIDCDTAFAASWQKANSLMQSTSQVIGPHFRLLYTTRLFSPHTLQERDVMALLDACEEGLPLFVQLTGGCGGGMLEAMWTEWHYYKGDFDNAVNMAELCKQKAAQHSQHDILFSSAYYLFHAYIHKGMPSKCMENYTVIREHSFYNSHAGIVSPLADYTLYYFNSMLAPHMFSRPIVQNVAKQDPVLARGRHASSVMLTLLACEGGARGALEYMQTAVEELRRESLHFPLCYLLCLGSFAAMQLGMASYSYVLLEEAYESANNGEYTTVLVQGGERTLRVIENYRGNSAPKLPANWLDNLHWQTQAWVQNRAHMSAYFSQHIREI